MWGVWEEPVVNLVRGWVLRGKLFRRVWVSERREVIVEGGRVWGITGLVVSGLGFWCFREGLVRMCEGCVVGNGCADRLVLLLKVKYTYRGSRSRCRI